MSENKVISVCLIGFAMIIGSIIVGAMYQSTLDHEYRMKRLELDYCPRVPGKIYE